MSEITIGDKNELMAIFEGWEKRSPTEFVKDGYLRYAWELKYHSDWSWLMPVCHLIREKAYQMKGNERAQRLLCKLNVQLMFGTREDVHLKAFDFIHWYQNQTKEQ